jgi:hypothetical protein
MLLSHARLATEFVYDCQFYHPTGSHSFTVLRQRFIRELRAAPPEYVVEITAADKPWLSGPGTTSEFPELRTYLARGYSVAERGDGYLIYAATMPAAARATPLGVAHSGPTLEELARRRDVGARR